MDQPPLIPAPADPKDWPQWRNDLETWRHDARRAYDPSPYQDPAFAWMRTCFAFGKVMVFDREFYDPKHDEFKVETWLDSMDRDFGGLDALALWQAYPRIGVDSRNQFDHYREFPGGEQGLKHVVDRIHKRGVKAVLAYNPWDTGTHREPKNDAETLVDIVSAVGFDGVFLDTLNSAGPHLREAMDRARPGVVLESELDLPLASIPMHHASWAQWFDDSPTPGIFRNKWFEPRHMQHVIRRWDTDRTAGLHMAWMNGTGTIVWQNVFGSWNGWSDRDKSIMRSMIPIQRRYAAHFTDGLWTPLVETGSPHLFASRWEKDDVKIWTVVNRDNLTQTGHLEYLSSGGGTRLFDLVRGEELDHGQLEIAPRGIGSIIALPSHRVDASLKTFLKQQSLKKPSNRQDRKTPPIVLVPTTPSLLHKAGKNMKSIPAGTTTVASVIRVRECGDYTYFPVENQVYPQLHQDKPLSAGITHQGFALMEREVTNREFHDFITATRYHPKSTEAFLKNWQSGAPMPGEENLPVVYISLEDARAYARWAGMRLPTEFEWQIAVQTHNLEHGSVWNWTESEHTDGHTTFSILKGGCSWKAIGSEWYTESGPQPPERSVKLIHFWPRMDRTETIGFRCAIDLAKK